MTLKILQSFRWVGKFYSFNRCLFGKNVSAADPPRWWLHSGVHVLIKQVHKYFECHTFLYVKKNISLPSTTARAINELFPIDNGGNMDSYLIFKLIKLMLSKTHLSVLQVSLNYYKMKFTFLVDLPTDYRNGSWVAICNK